ncbi:NHLP bacteriocin export ABC transporter permease/ATPase subunit [Methylorubrum zatmanii]|uniref:NHLP bacteriocin export ABC transporter permease/ATPase subunit n=1 Tax=Methylorubrum zatmanii TaxID=29429 RepID=A0ABW1WU45_9HYPH|nr:NHLP bacteriocin export ABC transporter permease/ATPase subunit [Methylorubrum zatmanii]
MLHESPVRIAGTAMDAGAPLILAGQGLRVVAGAADLYVERPGLAGRRRHFVTLAAGEIALPLLGSDGTIRLLAFPAPEAQLSTVATDALMKRLDTAAPDAIAEVEVWVERSIRAVAEAMPGRPAVLDEGDVSLDPGVTVRPDRGLLWVTVSEGSLHTDIPGSASCRPGDPPLAVTASSAGLSTEEGARILTRSSAALAAEGSLSSAILAHQARLAQGLAASDAAIDANEAALIGGKAARDHALLAATVAPVVTADDDGGAGEGSLAAAFRAVAEACAATLPDAPPPDPRHETQSIERQLAGLAAWAGLRPRRIRLKPGWWRWGGQPLLGFRGSDGSPVALIAGTGWRGGYRIREGGRLRRVGSREAAELAEHGYVLQRRLPDTPIDGRGLLRFAFPLALPALLAVLGIGLVGSLLGLAMPIATEILFETVIPAASRPELVQLVAGIAALGLGGIVFELVRGFLLLRLTTLLDTDLEGALWDRLLRLPVGFFRGYSTGDLALRAAAINQMRDAVGGTVIGTLLSAVFSVSSLALILYYEWRLALVAVALVLCELAVITAVNLRLLDWKRRILATEGRLQALSLQLIQGIAKLKVAGAEARGFARWAPLFIERRALELRQSSLSAKFSAFSAAFGIAATALMIGIVGLGGIEIGVGRFVAFNAAYGQFMAATLALGGALPALLSLRPLYERAAPLLEATPENLESRGAVRALRGGIELADIVFRYQAEGPAVLDGVSIHARPGEFVGIVGTSGSGKSTLMRVLLGFERPERGSVLFDDQNLTSLDLRSVRRQMGVVLQSSRTTGGTLMENILNGAPLTEADAWEAARVAGLDGDIRAMPMGLHTYVGEDGGLLSGGQRQRLLIARAVVRHPRILLFDEATSALDNRTQQVVSEELGRLDATRIVIAHRLSTVQNADRIYVLDAGRIAEQGSYRELLARDGVFAALARRQIA